jgi:hypothetical protein
MVLFSELSTQESTVNIPTNYMDGSLLVSSGILPDPIQAVYKSVMFVAISSLALNTNMRVQPSTKASIIILSSMAGFMTAGVVDAVANYLGLPFQSVLSTASGGYMAYKFSSGCMQNIKKQRAMIQNLDT